MHLFVRGQDLDRFAEAGSAVNHWSDMGIWQNWGAAGIGMRHATYETICMGAWTYFININLPVVPHKAVAEVSKIGTL